MNRDRDRDRDRDRRRRDSPRGGRDRRRRSRSRDRRHSAPKPDDQQKLREMLLMEAAKKNPDAAHVLQNAHADQEALQRALATASTLSASQHQQMQIQQQQQHAQMRQQQQQQYQAQGRPHQQNRIPDSEKIFLELHVGNLPEQMMNEAELTRLLNETILQKGLNLQPGNPVISSRINQGGRFAFSLFRNKEEATRALELSGMNCYGNTLRVDRPRGYKELYGSQKPHAPNTASTASSQMDESQVISTVLANTPIPIIPGLSREDLLAKLEASIAQYGDPTSLVQLSNLQGATIEEVEAEARKYGTLTGVKPSPTTDGAFLVKMTSIADAEKLVQLKRGFQRARVQASFKPLTEWTALQDGR